MSRQVKRMKQRNQEKQMKQKKVKANFTEMEILTYKSKPDSCLYLITNLDNGKQYIGVHKYKAMEYPGDGTYWHSSKNKEFIKVCNDPSSNLRYEVLRYGSYDIMTYYESAKLVSVDAQSNDDWYNDSNGSPNFKPVDMDKITLLRDMILEYSSSEYGNLVKFGMIKNCPFDIFLEDKELVYNMDSKQAREEMSTDLITYIKECVNKAMSVDKCSPVVIVSDFVLDGHHTRAGVYRADKVTEIPVLKVQDSFTAGWTDEEYRVLANMLNPKPEVRTNEMNEKDAGKLLVTMAINSNVDVDFEGNVTMLDAFGFNPTETSRIINKARRDVQRQTYHLHETHIHWAGEGWKGLLTNLTKKVVDDNDDKTLVCYSSTETLGLRALEDIHKRLYSSDKNSFLQPTGKDVNHLIVFVHAPTPDARVEYENIEGDKYKSKLIHYCEPLGIKVTVIPMPFTRPDTKVNPEDFWRTQQGKIWIADHNFENLGLGK